MSLTDLFGVRACFRTGSFKLECSPECLFSKDSVMKEEERDLWRVSYLDHGFPPSLRIFHLTSEQTHTLIIIVLPAALQHVQQCSSGGAADRDWKSAH